VRITLSRKRRLAVRLDDASAAVDSWALANGPTDMIQQSSIKTTQNVLCRRVILQFGVQVVTWHHFVFVRSEEVADIARSYAMYTAS